ncbi:hypothetical protein T484DRAFT_1815526 [Baffinella frigidus]|nr:hypothetical protein T484DRAFT_1815526 [Cryptophyta sp. CCMP2293]
MVGREPPAAVTLGEVVDARRVIVKLHSLAMDPRNRPFIARDDGCLHNIMRTFDYPAEDVVFKALETIAYLASHSRENRVLLICHQELEEHAVYPTALLG